MTPKIDKHEEKDGIVYVLENDTEKIEEITTINKLNQELDILFDTNQPKWHLWTPALDSKVVDTQRITIQQSVFLFRFPEVTPEMNMQEIVIPHQHKKTIRDQLGKIAISEITLFPDLLGFFERNSHEHSYDLSLKE